VKTSHLQCILSAMETLSDELSEIDHGWEWSVKVKRSVMVSIRPYSGILKERKMKPRQSALHAFFKKREDPQPGTSLGK
jgi:hypothetical protein